MRVRRQKPPTLSPRGLPRRHLSRSGLPGPATASPRRFRCKQRSSRHPADSPRTVPTGRPVRVNSKKWVQGCVHSRREATRPDPPPQRPPPPLTPPPFRSPRVGGGTRPSPRDTRLALCSPGDEQNSWKQGKRENHAVTSLAVGNALDKSQHPFWE